MSFLARSGDCASHAASPDAGDSPPDANMDSNAHHPNRITMRLRYNLGRHKLVWLVAIPMLLLAGHLAYWRIAAERLRSGYDEWRAARVAEGWDITSGSPSIGGWP